MKRKKFYSLIILFFAVFASMQSWAQRTVNTSQAQQVANTFMHGRIGMAAATAPVLHLVYTATKSGRLKSGVTDTTTTNVYYHIFNIGNDNGFVIVGGNDVASPILGYSDHGSFASAEDSLPPALQDLLSQYRKQIQWAIDNKVKPNTNTEKSWANYRNGIVATRSLPDTRTSGPSADAANATLSGTSYSPGTILLQTNWNQWLPYNAFYPAYSSWGGSYGGRAPTGCSVTATAEILYYWATTMGVPAEVVEDIPLFMDSIGGSYVQAFPLIPAGTTFDWGNMASAYSASYTSNASNDAVAKLMQAVGASQQNYGTLAYPQWMTINADGTGTLVTSQTMAYFGFQCTYVGPTSASDYQQQLMQKIDEGHPLYYAIYSADGYISHAIVCNGYEFSGTDTAFYFNFGWSGSTNGWYLLHSFNFNYSGTRNIPFTDEDQNAFDIYPNVPPPAYDSTAFVTLWRIPASNNSIDFPGMGSNYTIAVYDTAKTPLQTITGYGTTTITFPNLTVDTNYIIAVTPDNGTFTGFTNPYSPSLLRVTQWGTAAWTTLRFTGSNNLTITATDTPNINGITDMSYMFSGCKSINMVPNMEQWNVSHITNMNSMFYNDTAFNQPIGNWNTGGVTDMSGMFYNAVAFNQPLEWDVSHVTDMNSMFDGDTVFDQSLNNWNTSSVTDMSYMFYNAAAFNQPLNNWNTSSVTNMNYMFYNAVAFNQSLGSWNLSSVSSGSVSSTGGTGTGVQGSPPRESSNSGLDSMLSYSGLDCNNYSNTLIGWADSLGTTTPDSLTLDAAGLQYGAYAISADSALIAAGWNITDDSV
jgi:surface protein